MVSILSRFLLFRHVLVAILCCITLAPRGALSATAELEARPLVSSASATYPAAQPPGMRPEVFARGVVSTRAHSEFGSNFSPDGQEFYFTRRDGGDGTARIMVMRLEEGVWTAPETASFSGDYWDYHPCLSRDGKELFFGSKRPASGNGPESSTASIWKLRRVGNAWKRPVDLGPLLAGNYAEFISITHKRTLYFGEDSSGQPSNVYRARRRGRRYLDGDPLPLPIDSDASDAHPLIAPDESFLIFDSTRPGGFGNGDLYISFRREDGSWTEPENLGSKINSPAWEVNAALSHDGRYFFFHRGGDIHWVDAKALGIFRPLVAAHSDYDGDGRSDLAVFDPIKAKWKVKGQGTKKFGKKHSIPVPGDFNGNGRTDLAYFDPRSGFWRVRGQFRVMDFGAPGDIPVPADYDGDGSADLAFFDPVTGTWNVRGHAEVQHGASGDLPLVRGE